MAHVLGFVTIQLKSNTNSNELFRVVDTAQPILHSPPPADMSFRAFACARPRQEVGKRRRNLCVTRDKRQIGREGDTALRRRRQCDEIRRGHLRVVVCRLPNVIVCLMMTLGC